MPGKTLMVDITLSPSEDGLGKSCLLYKCRKDKRPTLSSGTEKYII